MPDILVPAVGNVLHAAIHRGDAGTLAGGEDPDTSYIVLIGVDAETSIDNLVLAINDGVAGNGAGEGTLYGTGTVAHPTVSAEKTAADTFTATALSVGVAGNDIDSETDVSLASWAAAHLASGYDAQAANDVLIGTVEQSIDYLVQAVTYDAGLGTNEGTNYGTGTVVNSLATAVKSSASTKPSEFILYP